MKMKKLSEDHYIIRDDSEIKEGDYIYRDGRISRAIDTSYWSAKKITHSTQPLNTNFNDWFDVQIITLSEVKELLGVVDVEKKSLEDADKLNWDFESPDGNGYFDYVTGYKKGYNECLEDNKDKKYTEEDLADAINMARNEPDMSGNAIIQSIQPQTEWEVEFVDGKLKLK